MKKLRNLILPGILICYALFYLASTKEVICDDRCRKTYVMDTTLQHGRDYILYARPCIPSPVNDTFCIIVKDTAGINWALLADTACMIAAQVGLPHQQIRIFKVAGATLDSLVWKSCP